MALTNGLQRTNSEPPKQLPATADFCYYAVSNKWRKFPPNVNTPELRAYFREVVGDPTLKGRIEEGRKEEFKRMVNNNIKREDFFSNEEIIHHAFLAVKIMGIFLLFIGICHTIKYKLGIK